jgi:hypothetical protein
MEISGKVLIKHLYHDMIGEVREQFMEKIKSLEHVSDLIYREDIEKTMTNDVWVERFLEWNNGKVDKTVDGIIYSLKYQKQYRIRELKESDFPSEFHELGVRFEYEPNLLGGRTLYVRGKYGPVCKETREMTVQNILFQLFRWSQDTEVKGNIEIFDFAGVSYSNVDTMLLKTGIDIRNVFPNVISLVCCVNVPTAVRFLINGVRLTLPNEHRKALQVFSLNELERIVHRESLPDFLGGTCKRVYEGKEAVPQGSVSIRKMCEARLIENNNQNQTPKMKTASPIIMPPMDSKTMERVVSYYEKLLGIKI